MKLIGLIFKLWIAMFRSDIDKIHAVVVEINKLQERS